MRMYHGYCILKKHLQTKMRWSGNAMITNYSHRCLFDDSDYGHGNINDEVNKGEYSKVDEFFSNLF